MITRRGLFKFATGSGPALHLGTLAIERILGCKARTRIASRPGNVKTRTTSSGNEFSHYGEDWTEIGL